MLLLLTVFYCGLLTYVPSVLSSSFTNEWAVDIPGGPDVAQAVARDLGYIYLGPVCIQKLYDMQKHTFISL